MITRKDTNIQADASEGGLDGVLLQKTDLGDWGIVVYASRALTATERYSQIEKETLAIAYACERFHQYVYGLDFEVESDHKPLEVLFKKSVKENPPRIQRLRLRMLKYNMTIRYVPGIRLVLGDTLSRSYDPNNTGSSTEEDIAVHVNMVVTGRKLLKKLIRIQ